VISLRLFIRTVFWWILLNLLNQLNAHADTFRGDVRNIYV
jgi:hypothetical protein